MLKLRIEDKNQEIKKELEVCMEEKRGILREVLKGELKYQDSLGWFHTQEWAGESQLAALEELASKIRKEADVFVLVGVGGSNNAARSVIKALQKDKKVEILYAGNTLSPYALNQMLQKLEGKSVYVNCIAKNFETLEPGASFRILRKFLYEKYGEEAGKRIIATGSKGSSLEQICERHGYTFLEFPENVGGRFSAVTSVGLLPMAVAGIDIQSLVKGAADMEKQLLGDESNENIAYQYACLRNMYYKKGYQLEMLAGFEPQFRWFYNGGCSFSENPKEKRTKVFFQLQQNFVKNFMQWDNIFRMGHL